MIQTKLFSDLYLAKFLDTSIKSFFSYMIRAGWKGQRMGYVRLWLISQTLLLAEYLTTSKMIWRVTLRWRNACGRADMWKENREISSVDSNLTLMAGERKAKKKGTPPSWRILHLVHTCLVHSSARRFHPFSPPSAFRLTHPSNPFFILWCGVFCPSEYLRSFVSMTNYITA